MEETSNNSVPNQQQNNVIPEPKSSISNGIVASPPNLPGASAITTSVVPSSAGPLNRRHSYVCNEIVTQVIPKGKNKSPTALVRHRSKSARLAAAKTARVNASVEDLHPAEVFSRCKPNDVILLYHDLSELASTLVRSVCSGTAIMVSDADGLRRRALHDDSQLKSSRSIMKMQAKTERANLVLWWKPFHTLWYFILECKCLVLNYTYKLYHNKMRCFLFLTFLAILSIIYNLDGPHQRYVADIEKTVLWYGYWVVLGIMSSVGLGTGLHTFVLYLGPFIAQVTLAAYECESLDFPEPPYPSKIECPTTTESMNSAEITLWSIMGKVRMEAMMWGVGTAIGELPPYFMARAARLSGVEEEIDDDDIEEILEIEEKEKNDPAAIKQMGLLERSKVYLHDLVHKLGFFGILAAASIPNPLFDLAGITCGHFLVPFWTFFGATLIGKAVIKMHIQKLFVIFAFSQQHIESLIGLVKAIPQVGEKLTKPFREYLLSQRAKLHKDNTNAPTETPWIAYIFEKIIIIMVAYFVISIINSFAQSYHKRISAQKRQGLLSGEKLH